MSLRAGVRVPLCCSNSLLTAMSGASHAPRLRNLNRFPPTSGTRLRMLSRTSKRRHSLSHTEIEHAVRCTTHEHVL